MRVRQWLVPAVIAAQFAVPLVALVGSEPPTRLGFQMYSGIGGLDITVQDQHGDDVSFSLRDVLAGQPRPDLDWTQRLPEALCETPSAARVTVTQLDETRTVQC